MFSIEHDFDATVITLVDEGLAPLGEDVRISAHDNGVTLEQVSPDGQTVSRITMTMRQLNDLRAAMNLPEGIYRIRPVKR